MLRLWRMVFVPVALGFIFLGIYLYYHLGANRPVTIDIVERPQQAILFKVHRGAYHKINEVITSVEDWAKKNGLPCNQTFGEYLDDPRAVEEARLTSHGGCLIDKPITPPEGFEVGSLAEGEYVRAEFEGSPAIGPWRVYPKLKEFIDQKALRTKTSTVEIYTLTPDQKLFTTYLMKIEEFK